MASGTRWGVSPPIPDDIAKEICSFRRRATSAAAKRRTSSYSILKAARAWQGIVI